MSERDSWEIAPCEYRALRAVYDAAMRRWAHERADFANAHFRGKDSVPWLAADFLGTGDRAKRQKQYDQERIAVHMENAKLGKMKPGAPPSALVPEWAIGPYMGSN